MLGTSGHLSTPRKAAAEAAGGLERGARTGEGIKDQFALAGGATHNALKQRQGFLRIVSCALRVALLQVADVVPHVRGRHGIVVVIGVDAAAGADGAVDAAIGVDVAAHVVLPWLRGRAEHGVDIEVVLAALAVEEDGIVLAAEIAPRRAAGVVDPGDLVEEVLFAEDVIQDQAQAGRGAKIAVEKEHAVLAQEAVAAFEHRGASSHSRRPAPYRR